MLGEILSIFELGDRAVQRVHKLRRVVSEHQELYKTLYGLKLGSKPKNHYAFHVVDQLSVFQMFAHTCAQERQHKIVNNKSRNCTGPKSHAAILKRFLLEQFKSLSSSSATQECFIENPQKYPDFDSLVNLCAHGAGSLEYGTSMHTSMGLLAVNDVVDYLKPGSASAIPCIAKLFFSAVSFTTSREGYYAMLQVMRPADVVDHWVLTNQLIVAKHCELGLARIYAKTAGGGICISNLDT